MKNLITTIAIVTTSLASYSQEDKFVTTFAENGEWSEATQEYIYNDDIRYDSICFVFYDDVILSSDESSSRYVITNHEVSDGIYVWDAVDEEDNKCFLIMYNDYGYLIIQVCYADYCLRYYCDDKQTRRN